MMLALVPLPVESCDLQGRIRTFQLIPDTPTPLLPTAPMMPETCVPWPKSSIGLLSWLIVSIPWGAEGAAGSRRAGRTGAPTRPRTLQRRPSGRRSYRPGSGPEPRRAWSRAAQTRRGARGWRPRALRRSTASASALLRLRTRLVVSRGALPLGDRGWSKDVSTARYPEATRGSNRERGNAGGNLEAGQSRAVDQEWWHPVLER